MRRLITISALLAASFAAPAHADAGSVAGNIAGDNERVGNGVVSVAVCTATATPAPGWTVVATTVSCSVNGFSSPTVTAPGSVAASAVANATTAPIWVCVDSSAIISPTVGEPVTVEDHQCYAWTV